MSKTKDTRVRHAHGMPTKMRDELKELASANGQTFVGYINGILGAHIRKMRRPV